MPSVQSGISLSMDRNRASFDSTDDSVKPKSPSNRFTSLFRWGSTSEQGGAPTSTAQKDTAGVPESSPLISPKSTTPSQLAPTSAKFVPPAIDISRANASPEMDGEYSDPDFLFPPTTAALYSPIEAIEEEVRAVSADLAASIRREMDLEDLIERLQAEAADRGNNGRRTSDYFSDAGTPVRYLDSENKDLDAEKMIRKVEQEKTQLRLDMLEKVQDEREKRRAAEAQVKELEEVVAKSTTTAVNTAPLDAKIKELELSLEDAKQKLAEERQMKENYEGLLSSLKEELKTSQSAYDKLRDEVVPQLKARVEGLESEASEMQKIMDEHSHMQAELANLRDENASLAAAILEKTQAQVEAQAAYQAEAEAQAQAQALALQEAQAQYVPPPVPAPPAQDQVTQLQSPIQMHAHAMPAQVVQAQLVQIYTGVARQSVSGAPSGYVTPATPTANTAIMNFKDRESLAERLKDVETQRDELHKALKRLRDRQQAESKKAKERIKALELERERALHPSTKRQGRDKEVSALRREIDRLRQRADDALEQKFVCERSLTILKMDLEKAEQETTTLRVLLQQHDDLISRHEELQNSHLLLKKEVTELRELPHSGHSEPSSVSLREAYRDLQTLHKQSLIRLEELEKRDVDPTHTSERERRLSEANEQAERNLEVLRNSLTAAEVDRDAAVVEAKELRKRTESLQKSEVMHLQEERSLAAQLRISSERVEELAAQVRAQLASNDALRERLADCIERGETEQRASAKKINDLQDTLRKLEDKVLEAQHQAEEAVSQHEDEIKRIKETHTSQLRRLMTGGTRPNGTSPLLRSPKLEWTSVRRLSSSDAAKTENLEKRVSELERALSDADDEMAEVVGRMNAAQVEVLELQTERDEAVRQTKRLHTDYLSLQAKYSKISL